jgi:lysozyme
MTDELVALLMEEERFVPYPYRDSKGLWTIGVGHLIDSRRGGELPAYIRSFPISRDQGNRMLAEDIQAVENGIDAALPWWRALSTTRQVVLASMAFQMGVGGLLGFRNTLRMVEEGRYEAAAAGMLESKWARQDTPARARRHSRAMALDRWEV